MARPVNANAQQTRTNILEAASRLFAQRGFDGTGVRQIADAAGVSLGMIRHYFGSKEGLYRACIESAYSIYGQLWPAIQSQLASGHDAREVLANAVRGGFRFACANPDICKLVLRHLINQETWRSRETDDEMLPFIGNAAAALAAPLGCERNHLALTLRTLIFLVMRYATADHDEVAQLLTGELGAKADDSTITAIEEHLVNLAYKAVS